MELSPARRLEVALALLGVIATKARVGGKVNGDALADAVPLDARDSVIEALRINDYVASTDDDGYALARDLRHTTVADLARDLRLTMGLNGSDAGNDDIAEVLDPQLGPVPALLRELGEAEERILGLSLADVVDVSMAAHDLALRQDSGVVAMQRRPTISDTAD